MAALYACDELILLTNGRVATVVHSSCPSEAQVLQVPVIKSASNAGQKQGKKQKKNVTDSVEVENYILASTISADGCHVALCDDRKFLHVYTVQDGRYCLQFSSLVARRCTAVRFTKDSKHVIVADKSGDAYSFSLQEQVKLAGQGHSQGEKDVAGQGQTESPDAKDETLEVAEVDQNTDGQKAKESDEKNDKEEEGDDDNNNNDNDDDEEEGGCRGRTLLLGHLSMLLDVILVDNDRYLVTSDRDEKIRLSHHPAAFNIHAYGLGHTEFVISLAYDEASKVLISGSGDGTVRLWNLEGKQLYMRNVAQDVGLDNSQASTDESKPAEAPADSTNTESTEQKDDPGSKRQTLPHAVQKLSYCPVTQLLCVALYRSPHILIYKLSRADTPSLHLVSVHSGDGHVAALCLHKDVLWAVRWAGPGLEVSAYRIKFEGDSLQLKSLTEEQSKESEILQTLSSHKDLLAAPPESLDLIPFLWKSTFQDDFKFQCNVKRPRGEGKSERQGKKRKQR